MAVGEEMVKDEVGVEEQEKRLMHYSSFHQILLVGEGDFSFSLCLGHSFASASNIVVSSLDPYGLSLSLFLYFICIGINSLLVYYTLIL